MKRYKTILVSLMLVGMLCGCSAAGSSEGDTETANQGAQIGAEANNGDETDAGAINPEADDGNVTGNQEEEKMVNPETYFERMMYATAYKSTMQCNPIMTQRFGADPYAMVYGDRVYFYMTADAFEYDAAGEIVENTYSKIRSINVVSTDDMVNFVDHGSIPVAGKDGVAKWANNSWAPAAAWKNIDGQDKFFLYFANSGGGIGVLTADSPTGPFTDPLGEALISRATPNCADVLWLFDPAVLVDDDGRAYIYFGGGVPEGKIADPGTARVAELGADMISIKGEAQKIDVPYLFEDSGIHKFGNKYYYTYCTNWQVDQAGTDKYGFVNAEIVSLESDSPMGPFVFKEKILENPGKHFGLYGNNHHCVFSFQGNWYMTYHARFLEKNMGIEKGYRATHIDAFEMGEDGTIGIIPQTRVGREQLKYVDAYAVNPATTMAMMAGLDTAPLNDKNDGSMVLTAIDRGDYLKVQGVDFGETAPTKWNAYIRKSADCGEDCAIRLSVKKFDGEVLGYLTMTEAGETDADGFVKYTGTLTTEVTGVQDLYLVFSGSGYEVKSWCFE